MSLKYPIIPRMLKGMDLSQLNPVLNIKKSQYKEEIVSHAMSLGMDPSKDKELLWIAETSLLFPTPPNWKQVISNDGLAFYYNFDNGEAQLQHPFDDYFRYLFLQIKEGNIRNANESEEDLLLRKSISSTINIEDGGSSYHDQSSIDVKKCDYGDENGWRNLLNSIERCLRFHATSEELRSTDLEYSTGNLGDMVIEAKAMIESLAKELDIKIPIQGIVSIVSIEEFDSIQNKLKITIKNLECEKIRYSHLESKYESTIKQLERSQNDTKKAKSDAEKHINELNLKETQLSDELKSVVEELNILRKEKITQQKRDDLNRINIIEIQEKLVTADKINSYDRAKISNLEQSIAALSEKNELSLTEIDRLKYLLEEANRSNNNLKAKIHTFADKEQDRRIIKRNEDKEISLLKKKCILHQDRLSVLENEIDTMEKELEKTRAMYYSEKERSKSLSNKIIEIQGNIRVFCRVRPFSSIKLEDNDNGLLQACINYIDDDKINFYGSLYEFEKIFTQNTTEIFDELSPLVTSVMDGHRVCIFTYGTTGSGKTFTMIGTKNERGVIYKSFDELFKVAESFVGYIDFTFLASVLEVYNDTVHDLLIEQCTNDSKKDLSVHLRENEIQIDGLTEHKISSLEHVDSLLELASENRVTATNNLNKYSSRSHLILSVKIFGVGKSGERISGKLNLIDLAGSERLKSTSVEGKRLKEAQRINSSLSALGDVIAALGNGSKHVPYRNSKLTYILQDSLKSNARVLMIVNINPNPKVQTESTCSLKFATRCRAVQLGVSKKNRKEEVSPDKKRLTRRSLQK